MLIKKLLHETEARNSGKNLLLKKDCVGMLVTKVQYTNAGGSAVNSSLWEKERMEILAKKLSHRSVAQSSVKLLSSVTDSIKTFLSEEFAEIVPKIFYRERQYRSASKKTAVKIFCPEQFQKCYRKNANCTSGQKNTVQNGCPKQ